MRSFKLACPFCGEVALISQSWLEKNDRVGCMNCNKSWEVSPEEVDLSQPDFQPDFFQYNESFEDEENDVLNEFVKEYLGDYYDEISDAVKKSKKPL